MNKYSDYFELNKGYKPEINPNSINDEDTKWQDTFPHETFIELLRKTERMLSRENVIAKHPLWIEGAYGTGKSRIAWTLDNLLTCTPKEMGDYFHEYEDLDYESDLLQKLLGHKMIGRIITAYKYGSDYISSAEELVATVFSSLTETFDKSNVQYDASKTLRGGIVKWLDNQANRTYFDSIIHEEPYCYAGCFAGQTADGIHDKLKGEGETKELVKETLKALRQHGVNTLPFKMEDLCSWIKETIEANNLKALILIWDEFSAFFKNNRTRLDSFQKLAELSDETPFNLIIVTHYASQIFADGDQAGRIVIDRFQRQEIKMPDSIAFRLIGHALKVKPEHLDEWKDLADDLNSRMPTSRRKVVQMLKGVKEEHLRKMLPFHPYAALILKNIANLFDSNQRSMFNFIVDDTPDLHAFNWYINEHGPESEEDRLLSVDLLWDYFYKTGHGSVGLGKSNLDQMVRSILDVYPREESKLIKDEQRVLKIVLMFQALAKKLNNQAEFLATEENLRIAFEGIESLETGHGITFANNLVKKGILFQDEIAGKKNVYQAPMSLRGRDLEEIEKIKQQKMAQTRTKDLISNFNYESLLSLPAALKNRFLLRVTAPETFKTVMNQLIAEDSHDYKMRALLVLARNESDAYTAREAIRAALNDSRANNVFFIDGASSNLPDEDFEKWAESSAKQSYYASKDASQSNNARQDAERILQAWEDRIRDGSFEIYTSKMPDGISCPTSQNVISEMQTAVCTKYPLTFDFTPNLPESVFKTAATPSIQAGVLGGRTYLPPKTTCVIEAKHEAVLLKDAKDISEYWKKSPDLPLSKLKKEIESMTSKAFAAGGPGRIAISEIIDAMIRRGMMPNNLSGYLIGFLLKEYAGGAYRYSDGENGDPMTQEKLIQLIVGYFKKLNGTEPRYRDCYIEVLTEEQRLFANLAKEVFNLQSNASIDSIAAQISNRVKDFQYPLWCFNALPESVGLERFIEQFTLLLNPANATGANSGSIATTIGGFIREKPESEEKLKTLFTKEKANEAMSLWLEEFDDGNFMQVANEIGATDVLKDVRHCFSADGVWLWNKETGEDEIRKVMRDYKIIAESVRNGFITKTTTLSDCLEAWREKAKTLKMPCATLVSARKDLKDFLNLLLDIAKGGNLEANERRNKFLEEITNKNTLIIEFFEGRFNVFKTIYDIQINGLDEDEKENLFNGMDMSSFIQDKSSYESTLLMKVEEIKKHQARGKLVAKWKEKTDTDSPAEWSQIHKTPVLAMVANNLYDIAKMAFDTINEKTASASQVEKALDILTVHPEIMDGLKNDADTVFRDKILGRYAVILNDLQHVRDKLKGLLGDDVYGWFGSPRLHEIIVKMAESEYTSKKADELEKHIDAMGADEAKAYLKKLVSSQLEIGIEILMEK